MGGGPHAPDFPLGTAAVLLDGQNDTDGASPATHTGPEVLTPLVDQMKMSEEPSELMANSVEADPSEGKSMEGQTNELSQPYQLDVANNSPVTYHHDSITDANAHGIPGASVAYCQACGADPGSRALEEHGFRTSSNNSPSDSQFQTDFARYSASLIAGNYNPNTEYGTVTDYPQSATEVRVPRPPMSSIPIHSQITQHNAQSHTSGMASNLEQTRITRESFNTQSGRPTLQQQSQVRTGRPMQARPSEMAWHQQRPATAQQQQLRQDHQAYPSQHPQDMAQAPQYSRYHPVDFATMTEAQSAPQRQMAFQSSGSNETEAHAAIMSRQKQARQAQIQQQEQIHLARMQQQQARLDQRLHTRHSMNVSPYPTHPLAPASMSPGPNRRPQLPIPVRYARGWNEYPGATFQPLRWTVAPACYPSTNPDPQSNPYPSPREMARLRSMQMIGCAMPLPRDAGLAAKATR